MEDEPSLEGLARSTAQLTDGDVAGAGVGPDGGASAVDGSADVVFVQRPCMEMGWETLTEPEPVSATRLNFAPLPRSM